MKTSNNEESIKSASIETHRRRRNALALTFSPPLASTAQSCHEALALLDLLAELGVVLVDVEVVQRGVDGR